MVFPIPEALFCGFGLCWSEAGVNFRSFMQDNTATDRPAFVTHLECSKTGDNSPADQIHGLSRAGAPLIVRYDLETGCHAG